MGSSTGRASSFQVPPAGTSSGGTARPVSLRVVMVRRAWSTGWACLPSRPSTGTSSGGYASAFVVGGVQGAERLGVGGPGADVGVGAAVLRVLRVEAVVLVARRPRGERAGRSGAARRRSARGSCRRAASSRSPIRSPGQGPVDRGGGGQDVGLDDGRAVRAAVDVLRAVAARRCAAASSRPAGRRPAGRSSGTRPAGVIGEVGGALAALPEHDVHAVAGLRRGLVGAAPGVHRVEEHLRCS